MNGADGNSQTGPSSSAGSAPAIGDIRRATAMGVLVVILIWSAGWRLAFMQGWTSCDDRIYLYAARSLNDAWNGIVHRGKPRLYIPRHDPPAHVDNRAVRASYIITLALWQRLVSASENSLYVLDAMIGVGIVGMMYVLGTLLTDRATALWSAAFVSTFPQQLIWNGIVYPDQFAVFWVLLSIAAYVVARRTIGPRCLLWGLGASIAAAVAFSAKETAIFVLALVVVDSLWPGQDHRRRPLLGFLVCAGTAAFFLPEFAFHRWFTGDWWYRFHASDWAYQPGGIGVQTARPFYYATALLRRTDALGIGAGIVVVGALYGACRRRQFRFLLVWWVLAYLLLEFGSTSLTHYRMLPKDVRYMPSMILPLFIPFGSLCRDLARCRPAPVASLAMVLIASGLYTANAFGYPLYFGDFHHCMQRASARARTLSPLVMPEMVYRKFSPAWRRQTSRIPRIRFVDTVIDLSPQELFADARGKSLVIPHRLWNLYDYMHRSDAFAADPPHQPLRRYLRDHARRHQVFAPPRALDRFFLWWGWDRVTHPRSIGTIYTLER